MKYIRMVQTADGQTHSNVKAALKHLDARYADKLLPLAHKLNGATFTQITELLDASLDTFAAMIQLKADMTLEIPDEDNE